jgi:sterol desaturase/sphingolipid hydroxylase (fatty acid hydroxylase superfamily)
MSSGLLYFACHMAAYWGTALCFDWDGECAQRVLFNQFASTPPFALLFALTEAAPLSLWHCAWQVPFLILFTDAAFYAVHRLLHHPRLFRFHRRHHDAPALGCAAFDAHLGEHVFANLLPPVLAGLLCRAHPVLMAGWFAVASSNTVRVHALPGQHGVHHARRTKNFGLGLYLPDRYFGTYAQDRPTSLPTIPE